jgi:hypothetical protein
MKARGRCSDAITGSEVRGLGSLVLVAEVDESPSRAAVWAKAGALVMHATQARAMVNAMPHGLRTKIARNWAAEELGGM